MDGDKETGANVEMGGAGRGGQTEMGRREDKRWTKAQEKRREERR